MPFTDAPKPVSAPSSGSGVSLGLLVTKRSMTARLTFTAVAQETLFGGPVAGRLAAVQVGRGADEGRLRLVLADGDCDDLFEFKASVRGSVTLRIGRWDLLPKDKRPAAECKVYSVNGQREVFLTLPSWAKPSGAGGAMEAEFGLKRPGAKR